MRASDCLRVGRALLVAALLLGGCGGGSAGGGTGADTTVARIAISPGAVLLTKIGESQSLFAQAYNKAGEPLPGVQFAWNTNHPATIDVDGHGVITAQVNSGSAQITASAGGIDSPPILALVAKPVPTAALVRDEQVAEAPVPVDPAADLDLGYRMAVTLFDTPAVPAVGTTVVGTGTFPIGGVVVATDPQAGGKTKVTFEMVALSELFSEISIEETFDLSKLPPGEEDPDSLYDMEVMPNGDLLFTLKPGAPAPAQPEPKPRSLAAPSRLKAAWQGKLGPFDCEADITPPVKIDANPGTFTIGRQITLDFAFRYPASSIDDLQFVKLAGKIDAEFKANLKVTNNLTSKVACTFQPKRAKIPIPIPAGPLSGLLTSEVQLGAELDLGGEIDAPNVEFEAKATATASGFASLECPPPGSGPCVPDAGFSAPAPTSEFRTDVPDPALLPTALTFKPEIGAFGTASASAGLNSAIPLVGTVRGELAKGKAGLKQAGEFSFVNNQVYDDALAASYTLTFDWEAGPGSDIEKLLKFFGISASVLTLSDSIKVAESPKATQAQADVDTFAMGDSVKFTIELDPQTTDYTTLFGYNVDEVKVYRKTGGSDSEFVVSAFPALDQTSIEINWVADQGGSIDTDGYYAFVETKLIPIDDVGELELMKIDGQSGSCPPPDEVSWAGQWATGTLSSGVDNDPSLTRTWVSRWEGIWPDHPDVSPNPGGRNFICEGVSMVLQQTGSAISGTMDFLSFGVEDDPDYEWRLGDCAGTGVITGGSVDGNSITWTVDWDTAFIGDSNIPITFQGTRDLGTGPYVDSLHFVPPIITATHSLSGSYTNVWGPNCQ